MIEIDYAFLALIKRENLPKTGDGFGGRFEAWTGESKGQVLFRERENFSTEIVVFKCLDIREGPLRSVVNKGDETGGRV